MSILRGFLPFILFSALTSPCGPDLALTIAAAVAVVALMQDRRRNPDSPLKILEVSSAVLFVALAVVKHFLDPTLSLFAINMCVNGGLALVAIGSMLAGQPFTLQYAREEVAPELWNAPLFIATNYRITGVWASAFVVQVAINALAALVPGISPVLTNAVVIVAYVAAILFTIEYPRRVRARARATTTTAHTGGSRP
jgi:uncharacterized membrane protein